MAPPLGYTCSPNSLIIIVITPKPLKSCVCPLWRCVKEQAPLHAQEDLKKGQDGLHAGRQAEEEEELAQEVPLKVMNGSVPQCPPL
jgi:hypothetical protein